MNALKKIKVLDAPITITRNVKIGNRGCVRMAAISVTAIRGLSKNIRRTFVIKVLDAPITITRNVKIGNRGCVRMAAISVTAIRGLSKNISGTLVNLIARRDVVG